MVYPPKPVPVELYAESDEKNKICAKRKKPRTQMNKYSCD